MVNMLRTGCARPGMLVAAFLTLAISTGSDLSLQSQSGCEPETQLVTPPVYVPLMDAGGNCTVDGNPSTKAMPRETFLKSNALMKQGTSASVTGVCIFRAGPPENCVVQPPENRYFKAIWNSFTTPIGEDGINRSIEHAPTSEYSQTIDTTAPGSTTAPIQWTPGPLGHWVFEQWATTWSTRCNIAPTVHPLVVHPINVLACKPRWTVVGGINSRSSLGKVTVRIPPGRSQAYDPMVAAAASWAALGFEIEVIKDSECQITNTRCVELHENYSGTGCGEFVPALTDSTGQWTQETGIRLWPTWRNTHSERLQQLLAHELGHYFGLANNELEPSCKCSNSVMGYGFPSSKPTVEERCTDPDPPPAPPPGQAQCNLGPMVGDILALQKATYGDGNRKVCGW